MRRVLTAVWCVLFFALVGYAETVAGNVEARDIGDDNFAIATNVCGNVSGTWTLANSPYIVTCNITVPSGQTLTIEPGVEVRFAGHFGLYVNGTLRALGTAEHRILFTRHTEGVWSKGIRFYHTGSNQNLLEYCIVEWGNADGFAYEAAGGGVFCLDASPTLRHCELRHNRAVDGGGGFHIDTGTPHLEDCYIHHNHVVWGGGGINTWHGNPVIDRCVIVNNSGSEGAGIRMGQSNPQVRECTISHNVATGWGGGLQITDTDISTLQFANNIVSFNTGGGILLEEGGSWFEFEHNDVFGNSGGDFPDPVLSPDGLGELDHTNANGDACDRYYNILQDPQFVNAADSDYRLNCLSACVDAGDPTLPDDPDGSISDIGALGLAGNGFVVIFPNGGESLHAFAVDTVRWNSCGTAASVALELNRNYPSGPWQTLLAETPNDGAAPVFLAGPPSTACRIRVRMLDGGPADLSNANFNIVLTVPETMDMSDLPACGYPTLDGNPGHGVSGVAWLGRVVTPEAEPHAVGDDHGDDGVSYAEVPWHPCHIEHVTVTVTAGPNYAAYAAQGGVLYLNGWKDGNIDNDFCDDLCGGDASEWILQDVPVVPGRVTYEIMDPGVTDIGAYDAIFRWRLTSQPVGRFGFGLVSDACTGMTCGDYGFDPVGEVEDWIFDEGQLAVELLAFSAGAVTNGVELTWRTGSETGNDHFEIVRDNVTVAQVGTQGNGAGGHSYRWMDDRAVTGQTYRYTLYSVDVQGVREELAAREVTAGIASGVVTEFALYQNSPNPFNPSTIIRFDLPEASTVMLTVYNLMGQAMATLVNGELAAGSHQVMFQATDLPSGVYLYRLTTPGFTSTKRLMLMK